MAWQIFGLNRVLQSDAGGGNEDGAEFLPASGTEMAECRPRRQVGVGLANPGSCVTQSNGTVQHGIQHKVAESDLLRPFCHALDGEQVLKNVIDHLVGFFPVVIGIHPNNSP